MKSIKAKIILSVFVLFFVILTVINMVVNNQIQKQTEHVLLTQSEVAVKEMGNGIENFMLQYEKALYLLTSNPAVTEFIETQYRNEDEALLNRGIEKSFADYMEQLPATDLLYFAFANKYTKFVPHLEFLVLIRRLGFGIQRRVHNPIRLFGLTLMWMRHLGAMSLLRLKRCTAIIHL